MKRLVLGILVPLALLPAASAQADGVDGGNVHLKLSSPLAKAFKREGVRLVGFGSAKAGKTGVTLPIANGVMESQFGSGYLFLNGGFGLRAGKRSLPVKSVVLDINGHALRGKVDGTAMKIAEPSPQQAGIDGFGVDVAMKSLKLTGRAANAFNRKLGLHGVFKAGRSLGSIAAVAEFEFLTIRGGEMAFTIDQGFREKLASIEASVGASYPARLVSDSPIAISISLEGGQIAPDGSTGVLLGEGGLAFTQHDENEFHEAFDHKITFLGTNIALDSRLVSGGANSNPNPQQIPLSGPIGVLPSSRESIQADPGSGEISGLPVPVVLHPNMARVMNEVFGAPKGHPEFFTGGEFLGSFSFRVQTR